MSRCISLHLAASRCISLQALPGINAHARRFPLAGAQSGASLIVFKSAEQVGCPEAALIHMIDPWPRLAAVG